MSLVGIDEDVYAATLREVKRQAAQLHLPRAGSGSGSGDGSGNGTPGSSNDAEAASLASASSGSGWVVLESATTPAALPTAAGCPVWPQAQWQIAYEILFCQCPPAVARLRPHQADDMLFFVYSDEAAAAARTRLFVRRRQARAAALPADLAGPVVAIVGGTAGGGAGRAGAAGPAGASKAAQVDWRASVLLMVVLQSGYRLSVVTADDPELLGAALDEPEEELSGSGAGGGGGGRAGSGAGGTRVRRVTEVVHASPSRVPVNLDQSRSESGPQASYPDICFAVDSCDHGFQSQVLRQPGDCYCVLLHADVASSWSLPASQPAAAGSTEAGGSSSTGRGALAGGEAAEAAEAAGAEALAGLAALVLGEQQQQEEDLGGADGGSDAASSAASSGSVSHRHAAGVAGGGKGQGQGQAAAVVFSGYVSHSQLTGALGGQLAGDPLRQVLRAAAAAARGQPSGRGGAAAGEQQERQSLATCRVIMRGPGGRGAADVAVSSFPPPAGDMGHLPSSASSATAPSAAAPRPGAGRPKFFERAQLLVRGMAAAAKQAAAGPQGSASGAAGVPIDRLHLRCALMQLQVPVDMLAAAILEAL